MGVSYTNRRGEVYYLEAKPAKGGGVRYSAARKLSGAPVDTMPDGYEFRELPEDAQVVVRRIRPSAILPLEIEAVRQAIQSKARLTDFVIEAEGKEIVVYLPEAPPGQRLGALASLLPIGIGDRQSFHDLMKQFVTYTKMMRLVLADAKTRRFTVDRWCFLGGIDKWYLLAGPATLARQLDKYARHLGQDSFYELM